MIRVSAETHHKAQRLAEQRGDPMSDVVAAAVDRLWREELLEATNAAYAALRGDPKAWQQELEERELWHSADEWTD